MLKTFLFINFQHLNNLSEVAEYFNIMDINIIKSAEDYVFNLLKHEIHISFLYHNCVHTDRVYRSLNEILDNTQVSENDKYILKLATLFHDTGYIKTRDGHEEEGAKIAEQFLKKHKVAPEIIAEVSRYILATKFNEPPKNNLEEIIKDADCSHFGKEYFEEASELLRQEYELQNIKTYTTPEWIEENLTFLTDKHQFFTDYALNNWQPQKEKNILALTKKRKKRKRKKNLEQLKAKYKAQYKAQYKDESPERAIQTFYRVALRNHIKLSDIADTKANILLSVNAVVISLLISNLVTKLDNPKNAYLVIPTMIFIIFSVISMILSIIATKPNVTRGEFSREDVINKNVNLSFFGNFHKMKLTEFRWAITELVQDKDYLYDALTMDLYFLGKVLDRKYRLLRMTYIVFMIGIIASVISFLAAINSQMIW